MKKHRFCFAGIAFLVTSLIQLVSCPGANAEWMFTEKGLDFKQGDRCTGHIQVKQTEGGFRIHTGGGTLSGMSAGKPFQTSGQVTGGTIQNNRIKMSISWTPVEGVFGGGSYDYVGDINAYGLIDGQVWPYNTPTSKEYWGTIAGTAPLKMEYKFTTQPPRPPAPTPTPTPTPAGDIPPPISFGKKGPSFLDGARMGAFTTNWYTYTGTWEAFFDNNKERVIINLTQNHIDVTGDFRSLSSNTAGSIQGVATNDGTLALTYYQKGSRPKMGEGWVQFKEELNGVFKGKTTTTFPKNQGTVEWNARRLLPRTISYPTEANLGSNGMSNVETAAFQASQPLLAQRQPSYTPASLAINQHLEQQAQAMGQVARMGRWYGGVWNLHTELGQNEHTMLLFQAGDAVSGAYYKLDTTHGFNAGEMKGTVGPDGKFTYKWSDEKGSKGSGVFTIADINKISGTYGLTDNPTDVAGSWSGTRSNW